LSTIFCRNVHDDALVVAAGHQQPVAVRAQLHVPGPFARGVGRHLRLGRVHGDQGVVLLGSHEHLARVARLQAPPPPRRQCGSQSCDPVSLRVVFMVYVLL
jgi:hypothetical protein